MVKMPQPKRQRAAAMLTALFIMTVCSAMVITIVETETLQYAALRNTIDYDRARYLAEAAIQHCLTNLESNISWRTGVSSTQFPAGSGNTYWATVADGTGGQVVVTGYGTSGGFTRTLQTTVKQGGN